MVIYITNKLFFGNGIKPNLIHVLTLITEKAALTKKNITKSVLFDLGRHFKDITRIKQAIYIFYQVGIELWALCRFFRKQNKL